MPGFICRYAKQQIIGLSRSAKTLAAFSNDRERTTANASSVNGSQCVKVEHDLLADRSRLAGQYVTGIPIMVLKR